MISIPFPEDFKQRLSGQFPKDFEHVLSSFNTSSPVSIKSNARISCELPFKNCQPVPWCETGLYLEERPRFILDPFWHAGAYYVQEAGSMFLDFILKQLDIREDSYVLDYCASPGGKSTVILDNIPESTLLISNEVIKTRLGPLKENLSKWGKKNYVVTNTEANSYLNKGIQCSLIVVDAPCSGEGLFRKQPESRNEWTADNAHHCALRQRKIIHETLDLLEKGGYYIYSTCTLNPEENMDNINFLVDSFGLEPLSFDLPEEWNVQSYHEKGIGYQLGPAWQDAEGFFIGVLKKAGEYSGTSTKKKKKKKGKASEILQYTEKVKDISESVVHVINDYLFSIPNIELLEGLLQKGLYLNAIGGKLGALNRSKFIPAHTGVHTDSFTYPKVEVELAIAHKFLAKQDFQIASDHKGWAVLTYQGVNLGLVKLLGNRLNNYYPKERRILNLGLI